MIQRYPRIDDIKKYNASMKLGLQFKNQFNPIKKALSTIEFARVK